MTSPRPRSPLAVGPRLSAHAGALVLLCSAAVHPAVGQNPPPSAPFRVEDAIALARVNHPLLAAASGRRMAAAGQAHQDGAFANPVLEYRRENLNSALQRDVFVTLFVPLDIAGRRLGLRAAGRNGIARAVADSGTTSRQVEVGAARAYWRAALATGLLAAAAEQRGAFDGIAAFTEERLREGAVAEQAAIRTRLEADRARIAEGTARAEYQRAHADLARAVGLPPRDVPAPPALDVLTAADVQRIVAAARLSESSDGLVAEAIARRPEIASLRAASRQAALRLSTEQRSLIPEPTLQVGTKQTAGVNTRTIGLSMPLPIFTQNGGARERARGDRTTADAELRDAENTIGSDVLGGRQAVAELAAAMPTLTAADTTATMSRRAADVAAIAETAYREGGASLAELLDARRASADARAVALRWSADLHLALLELQRALGAPLATPLETR